MDEAEAARVARWELAAAAEHVADPRVMPLGQVAASAESAGQLGAVLDGIELDGLDGPGAEAG